MSASILPPVDQGHAHEVGLGDTFDFLNTGASAGRLPADPSLDAVLGWFVDRAVIHHEGADRLRAQVAAEPSLATRELIRVRRVREALREVAHSIAEQRGPSAGALDIVNRALHARQVIELVPSPDGISVDHRHVGDPIDDALARLADPLASELTSGHPERIKVCDDDTCRFVFYDTSRTGRRRWCDMATCGNRAKAARHRARARGAADAEARTPRISRPGS